VQRQKKVVIGLGLIILCCGIGLISCDAASEREMAKRATARNEIGRAYRIYMDFCNQNKAEPAAKADLVASDANYPVSVEFYPAGYRDITWAIFARPWDDKVILANKRGEDFILEEAGKL
jgi:hypothetical protein